MHIKVRVQAFILSENLNIATYDRYMMSLLWEEVEKRVERLKVELSKQSEELVKDYDIFDSIANKKLGEFMLGDIKGAINIKSGKIHEITYTLPVKASNRNLLIIGGIIAKALDKGDLVCRSDYEGNINSIDAYSESGELLIHVTIPPIAKTILITCFRKELAEVVDKIIEELGLGVNRSP